MTRILDDYLDDIREYSAKASEVNRQLAFAGIAIVWLFKNPEPVFVIFPSPLVFILLLLCLALSIDLIHYLFATIAWKIFYDGKESEWKEGKLKDNAEVLGPVWIQKTIDVMFFLKIIATIWAYIDMIRFFLPKLI